MFSKIVPAFTPDNVKALGPLILVAIVYEGLGILFAWIIKQFFWVPHRFRYGILMAGGWSNYGDVRESKLYIRPIVQILNDVHSYCRDHEYHRCSAF